jgi:hypothetical protein
MENDDKVTSYAFKQELIKLAEGCTKLKPITARKKALNIWDKYDSLISYDSGQKKRCEQNLERIKLMYNTLKAGKINIYRGGNFHGTLLLKEIAQIEIRDKDVLIFTKSGREVLLSSDFQFLQELL